MLEVEAGGAALVLLAGRAVWWPAEKALLVADIHLGKAGSFRRLGVPVPHGTTADALQRLDALLRLTDARRLIVLGDLLHSVQGRSAGTLAQVAAWRASRTDLALTLVRGNHDLRAGDPPPAWGVQMADEPLRIGPLALAHHPDPVAGAYVLAGHVHPAAVVGGRAHDRLRLPCFHFGTALGLLPAFGGFTGMHVVRRAAGDRVYVVAGDQVRPLHSMA